MKKTSILLLLFLCTLKSFSGVVILNGLTHVHAGDAGSVISGKVKIRNDSSKEAKIIIYKQDLLLSCDKSTYFEYNIINSNPRSLGNWLKLNVEEKILAPREEYDLIYTINVPEAINQQGSFWTVLMIENAEPINEQNSQMFQVGSKVRYAVQLIAEIGNYESPKLQFENVEYKKGDSTYNYIQVKLKNIGAYSAQAHVMLEVYDVNGTKLKVFQGTVKRIYPNSCNVFDLGINGLPKGGYDGVIIADNGKDLFGSNVSIKIE